jgi:prepilin-type N-terminal cleavage/methylation domain-containing protein
MFRKPTQQSGFTLVELMAAVVTFGVVSVGLAGLFLSLQNVQRESAYLESATRAAQQEVESLRNNNYNQLVDNTTLAFMVPSTLPQPRSGSVDISEPTPGVKRVNVTVSYTDHGEKRDVKVSSLIGVIGISQ